MWNPLAQALRQRRKRILVLDREEQAKLIESYASDHAEEALIRNLANQIRLCSLQEFGGMTEQAFDHIMRHHDPTGWSPNAHVAYSAMLDSVK